jgi:hypothetical protein
VGGPDHAAVLIVGDIDQLVETEAMVGRHGDISAGPQLHEGCAVIAPGMLQNPSVKTWLAGVEPAWTLLD